MQVTIYSVPYAPACAFTSRLALQFDNRAYVLKRAIEHHMKHLPSDALEVVVDDSSKPTAAMRNGTQQLCHVASLGILSPSIYCQIFYDGSSKKGGCHGAATSQALAIYEALTETAASFLIVTMSFPLMRLSHGLSPLADIASLAGIDTYEQTQT